MLEGYYEFQSTRPMRGATHASRMILTYSSVSIHAPHAGRDLLGVDDGKQQVMFQSTRPMRGATLLTDDEVSLVLVSIHAPHAGRDIHQKHVTHLVHVSIHAPHAGRDVLLCIGFDERRVSIHAPHAGRDHVSRALLRQMSRFNPRAPCGARPNPVWYEGGDNKFQSTRPMRGATELFVPQRDEVIVSIHAPHAGRDVILDEYADIKPVSIHAPHAGRDAQRL